MASESTSRDSWGTALLLQGCCSTAARNPQADKTLQGSLEAVHSTGEPPLITRHPAGVERAPQPAAAGAQRPAVPQRLKRRAVAEGGALHQRLQGGELQQGGPGRGWEVDSESDAVDTCVRSSQTGRVPLTQPAAAACLILLYFPNNQLRKLRQQVVLLRRELVVRYSVDHAQLHQSGAVRA